VRLHELHHPPGRLLAELRLQLHLEHAVLEELFVVRGQLFERKVDPDVCAAPVVPSARLPVPVVLAHHGKLGVERYPDARIAGQLESRAVVEGAHHCVG
jgi:hypothetical protein